PPTVTITRAALRSMVIGWSGPGCLIGFVVMTHLPRFDSSMNLVSTGIRVNTVDSDPTETYRRYETTEGDRMALVDYRLTDGIATIAMDDGKKNALSLEMFTELGRAFDRA